MRTVVVAPPRGSAGRRLRQAASVQAPPASSRGGTSQVALIAFVVGIPLVLIVICLGALLVLRFRPGASQAPQAPSTANGSMPSITPPVTPPIAPPTAAPSTDGLDEAQARSVLQEWLRVKANVFAPPFDQSLLDQVVSAGPLWQDITKPGGSIAWLKENNRYYTYSKIQVLSVTDFMPSAEPPTLVATIEEDQVLHGPDGTQPKSSTSRYIYSFANENGRWKIYDYKKL